MRTTVCNGFDEKEFDRLLCIAFFYGTPIIYCSYQFARSIIPQENWNMDTLSYRGFKVIILDDLTLPEVRTKEMIKVIANINCGKALIVMDGSNTNVMLSTRNIPNVKTASVNTINVYDLLKYNTLVVTKEAVAKIEEVYA